MFVTDNPTNREEQREGPLIGTILNYYTNQGKHTAAYFTISGEEKSCDIDTWCQGDTTVSLCPTKKVTMFITNKPTNGEEQQEGPLTGRPWHNPKLLD